MTDTGGRILLLLAVLLAAPRVWAHETRPAPLSQVHFEQRLHAQLPLDLVLHDATGKSIRLGTYFGTKPVILVLSYYRCARLCPLVLDGLVQSLQALAFTVGKEFDVVTVSIDPRDTPATAVATQAPYMQRYGRVGAAAGWHFLTAEPEVIARLADTVGFRYVYDAQADQFAHASGIMVATPEGKLARYLYGLEYAPWEVRLSLVEAAAGRIGSPVDHLLLFCYHYDPKTGQYSLIVQNVLRVAGVVTVLTLGLGVGILLYRERTGKAR